MVEFNQSAYLTFDVSFSNSFVGLDDPFEAFSDLTSGEEAKYPVHKLSLIVDANDNGMPDSGDTLLYENGTRVDNITLVGDMIEGTVRVSNMSGKEISGYRAVNEGLTYRVRTTSPDLAAVKNHLESADQALDAWWDHHIADPAAEKWAAIKANPTPTAIGGGVVFVGVVAARRHPVGMAVTSGLGKLMAVGGGGTFAYNRVNEGFDLGGPEYATDLDAILLYTGGRALARPTGAPISQTDDVALSGFDAAAVADDAAAAAVSTLKSMPKGAKIFVLWNGHRNVISGFMDGKGQIWIRKIGTNDTTYELASAYTLEIIAALKTEGSAWMLQRGSNGLVLDDLVQLAGYLRSPTTAFIARSEVAAIKAPAFVVSRGPADRVSGIIVQGRVFVFRDGSQGMGYYMTNHTSYHEAARAIWAALDAAKTTTSSRAVAGAASATPPTPAPAPL